jgi:hypothetical protein
MLTEKDLYIYKINNEDYNLCIDNAKKAELNGASNVRTGQNRAMKLAQDQLVAQLGELVGIYHLYNDKKLYVESRNKQNLTPEIRVDKSDVPGRNIDFKTSLLLPGRNPLNYRLAAKPNSEELHENFIYIQLIVEELTLNGLWNNNLQVYLIGYALSKDLKKAPLQGNGPFKGKHTIFNKELKRIPSKGFMQKLT